MRLPTSLLPLFSLLLAAPLAAQRVVVVDAANGPGTTYTTLAPALTGLLDGDIIVVRAGIYTGVSVSTPYDFVMIGEGNPLVRPALPTDAVSLRLTLSGGYAQRVAIRGMSFESQTTGQWALEFRSFYNSWPAPIAQIEDCTVFSTSPQNSRVALLADTVALTAQRCTLNTTQVIDSLATFVECNITGIDESYYLSFNQSAETALDVLRSEVWIVDSALRAGNSNHVSGLPASCVGCKDSSTTVFSKVHVAGSSLLQADQSPAPTWSAPYVFVNYAGYYPVYPVIDYEPSVTLIPSPGGVIAGASLVLNQQTVPSLVASPAPIGGAWSCVAHAAPGELAIQLVATTALSQVVLGMPTLVDTGAMVIAGFGAIGGTGHLTFAPIAIPNDPTLRTIGLQSTAVILTAGGLMRGTNPAAGQIY